MNKPLFLLFAALALLLGGCADSGLESREQGDRGPAPYSPDPMQHIPQYNTDPLRGPTG